MPQQRDILRLAQVSQQPVFNLLDKLGLESKLVDENKQIPGSFWGDEEAGLIKNTIYVRQDTPVHSIFHETGHYVCMDPERRAGLHTNAGGTFFEENAVCYWQVAVMDHLEGMSRAQMCAQMDAWGYTFRLGSAQAWFEDDADDARQWLESYGLISDGQVQLGVRDRV